jgi:hypothetical protein
MGFCRSASVTGTFGVADCRERHLQIGRIAPQPSGIAARAHTIEGATELHH